MTSRFELQTELNSLMNKAKAAGYVITVYLRPMPPLAMNNFKMEGNVRMSADARRSCLHPHQRWTADMKHGVCKDCDEPLPTLPYAS